MYIRLGAGSSVAGVPALAHTPVGIGSIDTLGILVTLMQTQDTFVDGGTHCIRPDGCVR